MPDSSPYVTVEGASKYLSISVPYLRMLLRNGDIPFHRLRKDRPQSRILINKSDLVQFVEGGTS